VIARDLVIKTSERVSIHGNQWGENGEQQDFAIGSMRINAGFTGVEWPKSFGILVEGARGGVATGSMRKYKIEVNRE